MNELENGQPSEPEVFPLDDAAIEMIVEFERQLQATLMQENAVLTLFAKQHKLPGNWVLRRQGAGAFRELVKEQQAQPQTLMLP